MAHAAVTAAAVIGGQNRRPPALTMPFTHVANHTRRSSTMSSASSNSDEEVSPTLSALDSSAALILVHDHDEPSTPFDFTDDEDDGDEHGDLVTPVFDVRKSAVFPPLPPTIVFLYLLAPYLRLGALNLPNSQLPLKYGLPALLLSALASAYSRQIWYMLARYLRKADMTDVLLDTFARGRGKERRRLALRGLARTGTGVIGVLLAVTYLRESVHLLQPLLPRKLSPVVTYLISTLVLGTVVGYLSYAKSVMSRRIVYATWLSIVTYIVWISCLVYAHAHGLLQVHSGWLGTGSFWQGITTTAFAFCSSSTLPLYASLKTTPHTVSTGKTPRSRSFRIISTLSIVTATLLLLPSVLFAAFPNSPATSSFSLHVQGIPPNGSVMPDGVANNAALPSSVPAALHMTVPVLHSIPSPSDIALPNIQIQTTLSIVAALTLLLGIPSVIVTTPPPALPGLRSAKFNVPRVLTILLVILLALVPPQSFANLEQGDDGNGDDEKYSYLASSGIFAVLTATLLVMTLASTYFLPAFLHISIHFFKRPLAIVVPPRTPLLHTPSASNDFHSANTGLGSTHSSPRSIIHDELLLRKERALQKRQFKKRIIWDVGVWLLLCSSVALIVLLVGGFARAW
ncbi:hypothetical protein B0H34DRAFT_795722 [Crassisporium funariophilum]|nr:hypothetical protein B0H34DRAFT_795722 [Crassisporium funariophilum]